MERETAWILQNQDGQSPDVMIVPQDKLIVSPDVAADLGGMKDERDISELAKDVSDAKKILNSKMVELQNLQQSLKQQKGSKSEVDIELEELTMVSHLYEEVSDRLDFEIQEMLERQRVMHADLIGLDKVITLAVRIRTGSSGVADSGSALQSLNNTPASSIVEIGTENHLFVKNLDQVVRHLIISPLSL